jgi:hypothetical protein
MSSKNDRSYAGKANMVVNLDYGNRIYNADNEEFGVTPPPVQGFLIQDNGFYILQDNGFLIEYT